MKISFDHTIFLEQKYGGISRYIVNLALELLKKDQDVNIFSPIYRNDFIEEIPKESKKVFYKSSNSLFNQTKIINLINSIFYKRHINRWKPDIIHQTYYYDHKFKNLKKPLIINAFDMINEIYENKYQREKIINLKKKLFDNSDHIIAISENTKKDLENIFNIKSDKISVTHLGFKDFSCFKEYKKKTFSDKKYLLFVGRRAIYKNFNALLKAYSSSEELMKNFNIIQFGGNKFSKEEIELIKSLKIDQSNIIHLNGNDKTLFDLYSNASALILPSLYEGFGLPILEAMSIGCPVVCSNTSSLPEVAGSAVKYFDPKNYEDIKEAIISVVFSSTYKNELIKLGYDQVKKFSWEKCAKDTLKIYKKFDV